MKTTFKIFTVILLGILSSCTCMLSQIPPQLIYVDQNCQGRIPDFTKAVVVRDNCLDGVTIFQSPSPGTLMSTSNPTMKVTVSAKDAFGNSSNSIIVDVILTDTIPPILEWPAAQISMTDQQVSDLYKVWESAVKVHGIAKWIYDQKWRQGFTFPSPVDSLIIMENLKYFTNTIKLTDQEYAQYVDYVER